MDRLIGAIQHYDWGDPSFIAALQSRPPSGLPEAELWLGAHPQAPSQLDRAGCSLLDAIAADPLAALGQPVLDGYGELPFLVKILAADRPLSIQAHPSRAEARLGFDRENQAGVARDGRTRIYRDANHKPELICALTPFEAKCGLRPLGEAIELFDLLGGGLAPVRERLTASGPDAEVLRELMSWLLALDVYAAAALVDAALAAAAEVSTSSPYHHEIAWSAEIARHHPGEVGVVLVLLLNHVRLEPGEALFLAAGNLHAYLRGSGVEVMANSDNVVRGGLTTKHIDVAELLSVVDCNPVVAPIQHLDGPHARFDVPVDDFDVERWIVDSRTAFEVSGPEILVVVDGEVRAGRGDDGTVVVLPAGAGLWVPADTGAYEIDGRGTVFRSTVGGGLD